MKRVILESPYGSKDPAIVKRNEKYAKRALYDSLLRGEAPMASHLLYTQVLSDEVMTDRKRGMEAGFAWMGVAEACVVYRDLGISPGMSEGIDRAKEAGLTVYVRKLDEREHAPLS